MTILTKDQVREAGKRAAKATPGPWLKSAYSPIVNSIYANGRFGVEQDETAHGYDASAVFYADGMCLEKDADFIASARRDVPDLVETCQAQASEIERLRKALKSVEWILRAGPLDSTIYCCPDCCNKLESGHATGCQLSAVLVQRAGVE